MAYSPNAGEWFSWSVKLRHKQYTVRVLGAASLLEMEARGFETTLMFSVNRKDKVCLFNRRFRQRVGSSRLRIFTGSVSPSVDAEHSEQLQDWLGLPENARLLDGFQLSRRESLQVYRNAVVVIFEPGKAIEEVLAKTIALADSLPRRVVELRPGCFLVDGLTLDPSRLPDDLRHLVPCVRKWSIGDDVERQEKLQRAQREDKARLVREVRPYLKTIDGYISSEPLRDEAILLSNLALAVAELGSDDA